MNQVEYLIQKFKYQKFNRILMFSIILNINVLEVQNQKRRENQKKIWRKMN